VSRRRTAAGACAFLVFSLSCATPSGSASDEGTWAGTTTTDGNITTVINESGSVWGGNASLVEEASIGVDVGEDAYMFGHISGVYATDDEIFVLDNQVPALRVYDYSGRHLRDIGREGEGPGEFVDPSWILGTPDGRLFVQTGNRANVYSTAGELLDSIPLGRTYCCGYPPVVTEAGVLHFPLRIVDEETREATVGLQAFGPDGPRGSMVLPSGSDYQPVEARAGDRGVPVPFAPQHTWAAAPWGAIVSGISERYRFEIERFDGQKVVVEKSHQPVPVDPEEREWWRRLRIAEVRAIIDPEWSWDGAEIPAVKPPVWWFIPTYDERVWVIREGPGEKVPGCLENPTAEHIRKSTGEKGCWAYSLLVDVFGADGRFLGAVDLPREGSPWITAQGLYIRDRTVLMWITNDAGVHQVKRYRLVLPGEEQR